MMGTFFDVGDIHLYCHQHLNRVLDIIRLGHPSSRTMSNNHRVSKTLLDFFAVAICRPGIFDEEVPSMFNYILKTYTKYILGIIICFQTRMACILVFWLVALFLEHDGKSFKNCRHVIAIFYFRLQARTCPRTSLLTDVIWVNDLQHSIYRYPCWFYSSAFWLFY